MIGLGLLKSPLFWAIIGTLGAVGGGALWINHYGDTRYTAGVEAQRAEQAKGVAEQTDDLTSTLATEQAATIKTLQNELTLAHSNLVAAGARNTLLADTIEGLRDEIENNCSRVNSNTLRLLNVGACAYNRKYGLGGSDTGGEGCPKITTTSASHSSLSSASRR